MRWIPCLSLWALTNRNILICACCCWNSGTPLGHAFTWGSKQRRNKNAVGFGGLNTVGNRCLGTACAVCFMQCPFCTSTRRKFAQWGLHCLPFHMLGPPSPPPVHTKHQQGRWITRRLAKSYSNTCFSWIRYHISLLWVTSSRCRVFLYLSYGFHKSRVNSK